MSLRTHLFRLVLLPPLVCFPLTLAAQRPTLTTDWIVNQGLHVGDVPQTFWTKGGCAIVFDERAPLSERTFLQLDPRTGKRTPLLDMKKAISSLRKIDSTIAVSELLPWPETFDIAGTKALYLFNQDIYLLDLATASFERLTSTAAEEKDIQFSPDGKYVSFIRENNLYTIELKTKQEAQLTHDGSQTLLNGTLSWVYWEEIFGRKDTGYWWAPNSSSIAYLQTDNSGVPVSTFVDFEPVDQRLIRQPYPKPGEQNPKVRVGIVTVGGASTRWVEVADKPYEWLLRVKWLPDAKRLSLETMDRSQKELRLYFADSASGKAQHILTENDPAWVNVHDDLHFLSDGHFLWASERDGYMHLYRYSMDGTLTNLVTPGKWAMVSSGGGVFWVRQAVVGVDERNRWVYFTALKDSSVERQLYRVNLDGTGLTKISTGHGFHGISMSPESEFYFDTYSNLEKLPSLELHTVAGELKSSLAIVHEDALPADLQYPQLTTIPASDGFAMPAQILKPKNFDPTHRYPVILHIYGGPSAPTVSDSWQNQTLFDNLVANQGYIMVAIDNRAATGISKALENTLAGSPGEGETADLVAGVRWLKSQPWVDADRFGVWGWSGGGTNTLNLLTRSNEFKAGISGAPVTDWNFYDSKWAEALLGLPKENSTAYEKASLLPRAKNLHGSLLLMYGTYDDNVHPQNEEAFMNALIQAGKPYQVVLFPMRKHGFVDNAALIARYNAMITFWEKNL